MKTSTILLALSSAVPAVFAAELGTLWTDANFLGVSIPLSGNVGSCYNLGGSNNDKASTGKAKSGYKCSVWTDSGCSGSKYTFDSAGNPNKDVWPSWINDKASSWKCERA